MSQDDAKCPVCGAAIKVRGVAGDGFAMTQCCSRECANQYIVRLALHPSSSPKKEE